MAESFVMRGFSAIFTFSLGEKNINSSKLKYRIKDFRNLSPYASYTYEIEVATLGALLHLIWCQVLQCTIGPADCYKIQ